ncbi:hypothetical protein PNK_1146 [Candidatus Protochlamydia naegleriophila]|uniref:Uncharacterized protein n=1 Tax=Candidatus Protochlamydia naegleriophila TaxID=389348 RepID=A0A0U5K3U7_9BACT|nr:hypothetical protein [Candidatus Protochlamydia naegleriophila]CUI16763.1 hypothetical protein PNK_1146 [Candidatus Protochlamydia naegleriophila]
MKIQMESIQTQVYGIYQAAASKLEAGAKATGRLVVSLAGETRDYTIKGLNFASAQLKVLAEKIGVAARAIGSLAARAAGGLYDCTLKGMTFIATQTRAGAAKVSTVVKALVATFGEWANAVGRLVLSVAGAVRECVVKGFAIASQQLKALAEKIGVAARAIGRLAARLAARVAGGLSDYTSRAMTFIATQMKACATATRSAAKSGAEKVSAIYKVVAAKVGAWAQATGKLAVKLGGHVREYTLKAVKVTSQQLQNPRYAFAAVIASNIVFLEIMLKAFGIVDNLLNKTRLRDGNVGSKAQTFKEISLLTGAVGSLVALNMAFASILKPNISPQAYLVTSVASCISYIALRLVLAHYKQPVVSPVRPAVVLNF